VADLLRPWETRFRWILSTWHWAGLMLGVFVSVIRQAESPELAIAGIVVGVYVVVFEATPPRARTRGMVGELLSLGGAIATLGAVGLTQGLDSPYILVSISPVFFASAFLGARTGLATAFLSIGGLALAAFLNDQELLQGPMLLFAGFYLVIAVSISQARRALFEDHARVLFDSISSANRPHLGRLQRANALLSDLSRLADSAELNPMTVGNQAIARLDELVVFDSALVALSGSDGPAVVARKAEENVRHHRTVFPLEVDGRDVGFVVLTRDDDFESAERTVIEELIRPVALAFDNILLLRDIARRAVKEERVRLARELHDDIGPSLASLGLALDLAVLQYPTEPELADHLETLRGSVSSVVEDVRKTVADLRQPDTDSVLERTRALASQSRRDGLDISIQIDERRPPGPKNTEDLFSILTEALRNAADHADASQITITGYVDREEGKLVVADNGKGFDPDSEYIGHFGLIGMKERARRIGASFKVESSVGAGTTISLEW